MRNIARGAAVAVFVVLAWAALDALALWLFGYSSGPRDYIFGFFIALGSANIAFRHSEETKL